jgi:hypothetical protein
MSRLSWISLLVLLIACVSQLVVVPRPTLASRATVSKYTVQFLHSGTSAYPVGWADGGSIIAATVNTRHKGQEFDRLGLFLNRRSAILAPLPHGESWETPEGMALRSSVIYVYSIAGQGTTAIDGNPVLQSYTIKTGRWASTFLVGPNGKEVFAIPNHVDSNGFFLAQDFNSIAYLYWSVPQRRATILRVSSNSNVNLIDHVGQTELAGGSDRIGTTYEGFVGLMNSPHVPPAHTLLQGSDITEVDAIGGESGHSYVAGVAERPTVDRFLPWIGNLRITNHHLVISNATELSMPRLVLDAGIFGMAVLNSVYAPVDNMPSATLIPVVIGYEDEFGPHGTRVYHAALWVGKRSIDLNADSAVPQHGSAVFEAVHAVDASGDILGTATARGQTEIFVLHRV